jgi:hypothetical protein
MQFISFSNSTTGYNGNLLLVACRTLLAWLCMTVTITFQGATASSFECPHIVEGYDRVPSKCMLGLGCKMYANMDG